MEIRQIEYILAIYEEKSISRAAERLGISQPALSQQLSRLEEKYGVQFFQRNSRNLRLTPAGELFLENGRRILELQKQTDRELSEYRDSSRGSFTVGVSPGRCTMIVADIFPLFMERFPQYSVKIVERPYVEIGEMLLRDELDIGFYVFPDHAPESRAPFHYHILEHEEIQFAISRSHPLAHLANGASVGELKMKDIALFENYGFGLLPKPGILREIADQTFTAANIRPAVVYEVHDLKPIYRIVSKSNLCTFIPASYIAPEKRELHFHLFPRRYWDFSICWTPSHFLSEAESYFIQLATEHQHDRIQTAGTGE